MKIVEQKKYSIEDLNEEDVLCLLDCLDKIELSEEHPEWQVAAFKKWKSLCAQLKVDQKVINEPKD